MSFKWWSVLDAFVGLSTEGATSSGVPPQAIDNADLQDPDVPLALRKSLVRSRRCAWRAPALARVDRFLGGDFLFTFFGGLGVRCAFQAEGYDMKFVGPKVWAALHGWYGGGPVFPRSVVLRGYQESLELFPQPCAVRSVAADGSPGAGSTTVLASRKMTGTELLQLCAGAVDVAVARSRLWVKVRRIFCVCLPTVVDARLRWSCASHRLPHH